MPKSPMYDYYVHVRYRDQANIERSVKRKLRATNYANLLTSVTETMAHYNYAKLIYVGISSYVIPVEKRARKRMLKQIKAEREAKRTAIYDGLNRIDLGPQEDLPEDLTLD